MELRWPETPSAWLGVATMLGYLLPFVVLGGVFWFVFRQAQGSNNAAMSFGKRARMLTGDQPSVTFLDVAGVEEAKEELQEVVEFLQGAREVRFAGCPHFEGRFVRWPSRYRQDAGGKGSF